ncbi:hypothetical protein [Streptomyces sp. sk2.1]|uniref:hypothetical protein n=1 Tax=Streptomyces sp. sk2.1 TaxID=2478959 RepID=UPI0021CCF0B2|nr:hypothetical protein [Streptomyces sp. sk2.1]
MLLPNTREKAELIEVVRITDPMRLLGSEGLTGDEVALWEDPRTEQTLALISGLPDGELHRCFFPGWGVRVHGADGLLFRLAFCFDCHGVRLWGPGVPDGQEGIRGFDADSASARELLQLFRDAGSTGSG